jgi:hypothetical protein
LTAPTSRLTIEDVTLVAVTSVAVDATVNALHASMRQAEFGEVLLLSDRQPPATAAGSIRWRPIERLRSRTDYSRFMIRELANHISTSHALCVQWDGFVLNGNAWDASFLDYDYIGAVWPQFADDHNVGNGGFSLRSLRLLRACQVLPFDEKLAEDVFICRVNRDRLEQEGIRFAPEIVARRFSFERTAPAGDEFGFHGAFNLVDRLQSKEAVHLFRSIEQGLLARNERLELMRWALRRMQLGLAWEMVRRLT